jgi:hypothetical protein
MADLRGCGWNILGSLRQLEGVELFRRRSEATELISGCNYCPVASDSSPSPNLVVKWKVGDRIWVTCYGTHVPPSIALQPLHKAIFGISLEDSLGGWGKEAIHSQ